MVCAQTGSDMPNRFQMKGGTLSMFDDPPWHGSDEKRQGFFEELECDNTPQKLMICGPCQACYCANDYSDVVLVETILHRFWKQRSYPCYKSCLRV